MLATHVQVILVVTPFTVHQLKSGKTQVRGVPESRHENAHEANRREVLNRAHLLLIVKQGYGELIPCGSLGIAIAGVDVSHLLVGDVVHANLHRVRMESDTILEITLIFIQGIVLIDILDIGRGT